MQMSTSQGYVMRLTGGAGYGIKIQIVFLVRNQRWRDIGIVMVIPKGKKPTATVWRGVRRGRQPKIKLANLKTVLAI